MYPKSIESSEQRRIRWKKEREEWQGSPSGESIQLTQEQKRRYTLEAKENCPEETKEYALTDEQKRRYAQERKEWGLD